MKHQNRFLIKPRILPKRFDKHTDIKSLVAYYRSSGAYNGGRLAEACAIYENMLNHNTTICLTLAGAMIPTGLGGPIISLMEAGFIDFIISTGANLYHDIHFALDLPVHQGDFRVDDKELLKENVVRIYDIFITNDLLLKTDKFIQNAVKELKADNPISTAQLHNFLGKVLLKRVKHPEYSVLAMAAKYDVPIYTSSPGDSSIGMNLAYLKMLGNKLIIDSDLDILETSAIVLASEKNGAIELGGGSPKNFYMQTQPTLSQIMFIDKGGHDYFIQITTDAPHWGGLSGATPNEAVSWGKINPTELKKGVVVYCDATIAAPILFSYILAKKERKLLKKLYQKREEFIANLKKKYKNANPK